MVFEPTVVDFKSDNDELLDLHYDDVPVKEGM